MDAKHTPGPWFFGLSNRNNEAAIIGDTDSVVCYLPDASTGCTFKPADARLIAAAPTLLSSLRAAANYIDTLGGDSKSYRMLIAATINPEPTP